MTGFQVIRCIYFVGLLIGVSSGSSAATIYTFTTIDVPGATHGPGTNGTNALGINDAGQIVGLFDATGRHGFLKDGAIFTTIDVPGAIATDAQGINDAGQIVGGFATADDGFVAHGFVATPVPEPVPEPATWILFGSAVGLMWWRVPRALVFWEGGACDGFSSRQMSLFRWSTHRYVL